MTRGQATLALIDAAVTGPGRGPEVAAVAAAAVRDAVAVSGCRGEASEAARLLLRGMDQLSEDAPANPGQPGQEAQRAIHSSSRIEWTTESRHAPRTNT
jgi:hypothetical protein